jgi:hypothetical protein
LKKVTDGCKLQMEKDANPAGEENKMIEEPEEMLIERAEELQATESFQSRILNWEQETGDESKAVIIEVGMTRHR